MDTDALISFLTHAEWLVWLIVFAAAVYARLWRNFAAVVCFLGVKLLVAVAYPVFLLYPHSGLPGARWAYTSYFIFFWCSYGAATVAVFFSIEQIIRRVLSPLSGLSRLGVLIFRFTGGLTLFIALTAHLSEMRSLPFNSWLRALFISFGLCMCVLEVALMGLLMGTAHRLGLNFRTRIFGLSLGLCALGLMDFLNLSMASSAWAGGGLTNELLLFATLFTWVAYFVLPDQKRGTMLLPGSSTLLRWNEVVSQLGPDGQSLPKGPNSFMSEVEELVDSIMLRNKGTQH